MGIEAKADFGNAKEVGRTGHTGPEICKKKIPTSGTPLARYRAVEGALASGFATTYYTTCGDATQSIDRQCIVQGWS